MQVCLYAVEFSRLFFYIRSSSNDAVSNRQHDIERCNDGKYWNERGVEESDCLQN
jgi:hypothetical protein